MRGVSEADPHQEESNCKVGNTGGGGVGLGGAQRLSLEILRSPKKKKKKKGDHRQKCDLGIANWGQERTAAYPHQSVSVI